ncbi:hypothetical protein BDN72DRAFT_824541, partial [Pluteus cervinus]
MSAPPPHPILAQRFESSKIAFTEIDNEIAALYERIHALRTYRNSFTPVYRIPPEILTRIFSFAQQWSARSCWDSTRSGLPGWVVVTHVSQYWRSVAIGSPDLWSYISSSYPD